MAQTFPATKASQERPYTLLSIGGYALLLPQSEIRTLASIQDISLVGQRASGVVGWLPIAGRRWPVYCLDEALHPLPYLSPRQGLCALVKLNASYFGLVCAHVAASIMGSATLCFSRWTQRGGRQLHRCQNRRKHRARLLPEKPLRCRRPVRPGEEKVVNSGEALPLPRQIESPKLMATQ